jgi:hypothetical protein
MELDEIDDPENMPDAGLLPPDELLDKAMYWLRQLQKKQNKIDERYDTEAKRIAHSHDIELAKLGQWRIEQDRKLRLTERIETTTKAVHDLAEHVLAGKKYRTVSTPSGKIQVTYHTEPHWDDDLALKWCQTNNVTQGITPETTLVVPAKLDKTGLKKVALGTPTGDAVATDGQLIEGLRFVTSTRFKLELADSAERQGEDDDATQI